MMSNVELGPELTAQVRDLREITRVLTELQEDEDAVNKIVKAQFIARKKEVITNVVSLLLKSEIEVKQLIPVLNKAVDYLKKHDQVTQPSSSVIETVKEFERLIL